MASPLSPCSNGGGSTDPTNQPDRALVTDPELLVATWRTTELYGRAVGPTLRVDGRHVDLTFAKCERKGWSRPSGPDVEPRIPSARLQAVRQRV